MLLAFSPRTVKLKLFDLERGLTRPKLPLSSTAKSPDFQPLIGLSGLYRRG